jgi:O-antigen/teichoic acid export membrane protein
MSRSIRNTIANIIGVVSTTAFAFIFAIVYFRILGSENYGLISLCTTMLLLGNLFVDIGIGRAVTRELARREHAVELAQEMRDALFTLQAVHFSLAFVCGIVIAASSRWLATHWLQRETLGIDEAVQAITLLGIVATLQLPRELCRSALAGLQRQVFLNVCTASISLLRGITTLAALHWIAPTATVFLLVQVIVSAFETAVLLFAVWQRMPSANRWPRFDGRVIKETWQFAAGDGLGSLLYTCMMMGDRVLLSRLLPLNVFGGYSLAALIADTMLRATEPFTSAYFPHFTDLIARHDKDQLSREYHRVTIIVAAILIPAAFVLAFFSEEILQLVSGNQSIAKSFAAVLAIRALANAANGLQHFPHLIQLATGLSSTALILNVFNVGIYLPGIMFLTPLYGVIVPAVLLLFVNLFQTVPMILVTHRRAMQGEAWNWILGSVLRPVLITLVVVSASSYLAPKMISWLVTVPWLAATYVLAMAAILLLSKTTRLLILGFWHRRRER